MNSKVLALVEWVQQGFEIGAIEDVAQGGVRILLRRGTEHRTLGFHHYELPAVVQECTTIGVAK